MWRWRVSTAEDMHLGTPLSLSFWAERFGEDNDIHDDDDDDVQRRELDCRALMIAKVVTVRRDGDCCLLLAVRTVLDSPRHVETRVLLEVLLGGFLLVVCHIS